MPAQGFKAKRQPVPVKFSKDAIPMSEVMRLARNAAGMAMKGKAYGPDDRADAAATITLRVWEAASEAGRITRAPGSPAKISGGTTGAPAAMPTSLGGRVKMSKGKKAKAAPALLIIEPAVPAEMATMKILLSHASNLRKSLLRDRNRQERLGAIEARERGFVAHVPSMSYGAPADPAEAHRAARAMLGELGLARLGKAYPLAYAAARAAAGMLEREVATELGVSRGTFVSTLSRQAAKVPSGHTHSYRAHADALHVDEHRDLPRVKAAAGLSEATRERSGDTVPNTGTPSRSEAAAAAYRAEYGPHAELPARGRKAIVSEHPVSERRLAGGRRKWNGKTAAEWTTGLHPATRGRLHRSAEIQRERAAAKRAGEAYEEA